MLSEVLENLPLACSGATGGHQLLDEARGAALEECASAVPSYPSPKKTRHHTPTCKFQEGYCDGGGRGVFWGRLNMTTLGVGSV